MPIYEYRCRKCGQQFEILQAMGADGSKLKCPDCKAAEPQKLISASFSASAGSSFRMADSCTSGT